MGSIGSGLQVFISYTSSLLGQRYHMDPIELYHYNGVSMDKLAYKRLAITWLTKLINRHEVAITIYIAFLFQYGTSSHLACHPFHVECQPNLCHADQ